MEESQGYFAPKEQRVFFFFKHIPDFASIPKDFTADVKELYINQDWKHGQEKKKRNHIQRKWHSEEKKKNEQTWYIFFLLSNQL